MGFAAGLLQRDARSLFEGKRAIQIMHAVGAFIPHDTIPDRLPFAPEFGRGSGKRRTDNRALYRTPAEVPGGVQGNAIAFPHAPGRAGLPESQMPVNAAVGHAIAVSILGFG